MRLHDFRSDTVTLPTPAMMSAVADVRLGDAGRGDDPTVNALERLACEIMGKQDALLLPSGTMANLAAVIAHDGILVIAQGVEARVVAPRLLHELELTPDVGVDAEEMHASRLPIVHQVEQRPAGGIR